MHTRQVIQLDDVNETSIEGLPVCGGKAVRINIDGPRLRALSQYILKVTRSRVAHHASHNAVRNALHNVNVLVPNTLIMIIVIIIVIVIIVIIINNNNNNNNNDSNN